MSSAYLRILSWFDDGNTFHYDRAKKSTKTKTILSTYMRIGCPDGIIKRPMPFFNQGHFLVQPYKSRNGIGDFLDWLLFLPSLRPSVRPSISPSIMCEIDSLSGMITQLSSAAVVCHRNVCLSNGHVPCDIDTVVETPGCEFVTFLINCVTKRAEKRICQNHAKLVLVLGVYVWRNSRTYVYTPSL